MMDETWLHGRIHWNARPRDPFHSGLEGLTHPSQVSRSERRGDGTDAVMDNFTGQE